MVKGFDKFKQYFAPHSDSFIVIGGTAMQLHGREAGPVPRVTQDIDILVIVEQMSESFTSALHAFLREGRYDCYIAKEPDGSNKPRFYRFINPKNGQWSIYDNFEIPTDLLTQMQNDLITELKKLTTKIGVTKFTITWVNPDAAIVDKSGRAVRLNLSAAVYRADARIYRQKSSVPHFVHHLLLVKRVVCL